MQPFLMRSDFDPFQVAVIVIFVLASFIKWLWENWQAKRGSAPEEAPGDLEEERLREAAWRRQTGQASPPPLPPPVAASPWDDLKKVWQEVQESVNPTPAPTPTPTPTPTVARHQPQRSPAEERRPAKKAAAAPMPAQSPLPREAYSLSAEGSSGASPLLATLRRLRKDPTLMRQAVLMHEVLGPPKALQSSSDPAI